jgi:hypothetical protein
LATGGKVIIGGISGEKPRRDSGILEYDPQQESGLTLPGNCDTNWHSKRFTSDGNEAVITSNFII